MTDPADDRPPPAFYATSRRGRLGAWWSVLHPPYTAWHLGYVLIGAGLAPVVDLTRLVATLLAFLLAVGVSAHALDELRSRPLRTTIPDKVLRTVAFVALAAAVALGIAGIARVGWLLAVFVVVGVGLVLGYSLELFGGRLHTDLVFALAWGAFPTLTGYLAQTGTIDVAVAVVAAGAAGTAAAQRTLSTPVRRLRRDVKVFRVRMETRDGRVGNAGPEVLLAPAERALRLLSWSIVALGLGAVLARLS
jgi:hypothetical protein